MRPVLLCVFVLALLVGQASADIYYLYEHEANGTPKLDAQGKPLGGGTETINGAVFNSMFLQPTGTGVFQPFVRIQRSGTQEGYNSDAAQNRLPFDEKAGEWTHALTLGDVPVSDGSLRFLLDINEKSTDPLLSLDALKIFVGTPADVATGSAQPMPTDLDGGALGDQVYDLGDNTLVLHYRLNKGSGSGDMEVFVPQTLFAGHGPDDYLTLYSAFGGLNPSDDGFEEWAVVPAPGAVLLGLLGLGAAGVRLRRFV